METDRLNHPVRAWLQLLRVPNLFTVPGDPLAGLVLTAVALSPEGAIPIIPALLAVAASLALYCAGLIDNDLAGFAEDLRDRPERPLPSGRIPRWHAAIALAVFAGLGLLAAFVANMVCGYVALVLLGVILAYNHLLKRVPLAGPVTMGLCRGLSVMIGATAIDEIGLHNPVAYLAAGLIALYIAAVTSIASRETHAKPVGWHRNMPAWVLAFFFTLIIASLNSYELYWPFIPFAAAATLWAGWCAILLGRDKNGRAIPPVIGKLIRDLLLVQAAFCTVQGTEGLAIAGVLLAMFPVSAIVSKRFYAS